MEKQELYKKPNNLTYGLKDNPPLNVILPLVLQQLAILSSNLVYPVIIAGLSGGPAGFSRNFVAIMLIATGVGSILQAIGKKSVGSGFLCVEESGSMYFPASVLAINAGGISLLLGMTIIAGLFEMFLSQIIHRLRFLFPPEVTGLVVTVVGISIIKIGIESFFGVKQENYQLTYDAAALMVAFISLVTAVSINVWGKNKFQQYSILFAILAGYIAAYCSGILTDVQLATITQAPLLAFPENNYVNWTFNNELVFPVLVVVICSSIKTIGNITTCQKSNDSDWKRLDIETTKDGLMAEGLGTLISGLIGGMGLSSSSGSVGLSIVTGATSRKIAFFIGGACILLAFSPKLIACFLIMPKPVMGAILIINMSFIILAGIQIVVSRMLDARKTFVIGISLIFGLSVDILPELYHQFPLVLQPILTSSLSVTSISAILLNWIFRLGISNQKKIEFETDLIDSEKICSFMETQGRLWGVRPDIIRKASFATNEFMEIRDILEIVDRKISLTVSFDEFNLDVLIDYDGLLPEFNAVCPSNIELLEDEYAPQKLSLFLIKKYVDNLNLSKKNGRCYINFHYAH